LGIFTWFGFFGSGNCKETNTITLMAGMEMEGIRIQQGSDGVGGDVTDG
jgi:hypothetical protein